MPRVSGSTKNPVISCELLPETRQRIASYANALVNQAHVIGHHDLNKQEFWDSGIFKSAVEQLRGKQAASTAEKKSFMQSVLEHLEGCGQIAKWEFKGSGERYDYEVTFPDGWISIIETKGCLDGNNTNIYERPPHADEFVVWSLCQNPGADPRHNAWSGLHTRLGAEVIHRQQRIDGVVIWDMVCGTAGRPCPKQTANPSRFTSVNKKKLPPPCLYLFPRSIPDPRNNPKPPCWKIKEVRLLNALWEQFKGNADDIVEVRIESRMTDARVERRTRFLKKGSEFSSSEWTVLKRARR